MFLILMVAVLVGAGVHAARVGERSRRRVGEIVLRWVLVGYCGLPMVVMALLLLVHPHEIGEWLGFPADSLLAGFFGWAYLGMAAAAALALVYRGVYLVGPAVTWALFFMGATAVHLGAGHATTHGGALMIVATHGLVSVLLGGALVASGVWRRP